MFTFSVRKMFFALAAVCVFALTVQSALAVEVEGRDARRAATLNQEAESVRQRADAAVDNLENRARTYEDRIKIESERIEDRANAKAQNLENKARAYEERAREGVSNAGSDDWFGGTTTQDRMPVNDRLDYMQARQMGGVLHPAITSPAYRSDLTESERSRITSLEKRRDEQQNEYFEKRRELESKLSTAAPGSAEAKDVEEELWNLENDFSRQQVRFQEDIKDYVRQ